MTIYSQYPVLKNIRVGIPTGNDDPLADQLTVQPSLLTEINQGKALPITTLREQHLRPKATEPNYS